MKIVFAICHQFKVRKSIVRLGSIDMMDYFSYLKFSAKMLFHDMAMLANRFAAFFSYPNKVVSFSVKTAASFWSDFNHNRIAVSLPSSVMLFAPCASTGGSFAITDGTDHKSIMGQLSAHVNCF